MKSSIGTKTSEDSLLELRIRMERWVKRNRLWLIVTAAVILIWLAAALVLNLMEKNRIQAANSALIALQANPNDQSAADRLSSRSPQLYNLFMLSKAAEQQDRTALERIANGNDLAADLASYQLALLSEDPQTINRYALRENAPLKELGYLSEAILWHEQGNHDQARTALQRIGFDSDLRDFATVLQNYGIRAE